MQDTEHDQTAAVAAPVRGPLLAHLVMLLGFAVLFTVFATHSVASVAIGVVLLLAGGLWEGAAPDEPLVGAAVGVEEPHGSGH